MTGRLLPFLALLIALPPVPVAAQTAPQGESPAEPAGISEVSHYRLRAGDGVRLLIQDEPDLGGEYLILEDGTVPLPLIGLVRVGGVAFGEVVERVRAAYAAEFVNTTVVLQPLIRVRVLGEVRTPGLYLVDATFRLRDVLAQAGGVGPAGNPRRVLLVRGSAAEAYDLTVEQTGGVLEPGDEIVVARRSWVRENMPILVGAGTSVLAAALTALLVR